MFREAGTEMEPSRDGDLRALSARGRAQQCVNLGKRSLRGVRKRTGEGELGEAHRLVEGNRRWKSGLERREVLGDTRRIAPANGTRQRLGEPQSFDVLGDAPEEGSEHLSGSRRGDAGPDEYIAADGGERRGAVRQEAGRGVVADRLEPGKGARRHP